MHLTFRASERAALAGLVVMLILPADSGAAQAKTASRQGKPGLKSTAGRPRPVATVVVVRDRSGSPLAGARVIVAGATSREATTNASGAASLGLLADGAYRLRFERDGYVTLEREVTVKNGQPAQIDAALSAASPPPMAPKPEPALPPAPAAAPGSQSTVSIPLFIDKNFIGRDPLKESVLGCTPGATTRLLQLRDPLAVHTHGDADEILYVVAGEGAVRVRDETRAVSAGSLSVIPRGLPHAIERRGKNPLIVLSTLAGAPCQPASTAQPGKE